MSAAEFKDVTRLIVDACAGRRFSRMPESALQRDLENVFTKAGFAFEREFILSKLDRADFFFYQNGVVLETKVEGGVEAHLRQLRRYAEQDMVTGLILIAMRPYRLPATLNGKPVVCLNFANKCL